jgi:hypothetical protein
MKQAPSKFTVLGWRVSDLHAAMEELAAAGVQFKRYEGFDQDADGAWTAPNGTKLAWFEDPDQNVISLHQAD